MDVSQEKMEAYPVEMWTIFKTNQNEMKASQERWRLQ